MTTTRTGPTTMRRAYHGPAADRCRPPPGPPAPAGQPDTASA